jgi:hypothetical protein
MVNTILIFARVRPMAVGSVAEPVVQSGAALI